MTALRATKVYRVTTASRAPQPATSICSLSASDNDRTLDISFDLALRKGGKAHLVVAIGKSDLTLLIGEAMSRWPDMGPAMADKIVGTMAVALEQQRAFQATVAARTLKQLEQVDHTLDALADEDLPRSAVRKLVNAGNALEGARGTLEAL